MRRKLRTCKYCTTERQFTQLSYDEQNEEFLISVFFRNTDVFLEKEYKNLEDAERLYNIIIK